MKKIIFVILSLLVVVMFLAGCTEKQLTEEEQQTLESELEKLSPEELNAVIEEGESEESKALAGQAYKKFTYKSFKYKPKTVLKTAYRVKAKKIEPLFRFKEYSSNTDAQQLIYTLKPPLSLSLVERYENVIFPDFSREEFCPIATAAELMASCPSIEEVKQIRKDFNIMFESELEENRFMELEECTNGGDESSIMLSVYNTFRLMKCIPFDINLTWSPEYDNLYNWTKSRNLEQINYFWAGENEFSHGSGGSVFMKANQLNHSIYRHAVDPEAPVGLIHSVTTLMHEVRHAEANIFHNCDINIGSQSMDTNLEYGGAWAVHYQLWSLLVDHTGTFFSDYEKEKMAESAAQLYRFRFCDYQE